MTSVLALACRLILPAPTATTAELATGLPAADQFSVDVPGNPMPALNAARNPAAAHGTAVRLINTAFASAGTPLELAVTSTARAVPPTNGVFGPTAVGGCPARESYTRTLAGRTERAPAEPGAPNRSQVPGVPSAMHSHMTPVESPSISPAGGHRNASSGVDRGGCPRTRRPAAVGLHADARCPVASCQHGDPARARRLSQEGRGSGARAVGVQRRPLVDRAYTPAAPPSE